MVMRFIALQLLVCCISSTAFADPEPDQTDDLRPKNPYLACTFDCGLQCNFFIDVLDKTPEVMTQWDQCVDYCVDSHC
jgi:hypothetical protein